MQECLDSILQQSYSNWELVIVNDHSTDNTRLVLDDYALLDSRIKVYESDGHGIIPALRIAYKHAQGAYIAKMDCDDIMALKRLELSLDLIKRKGEGYVVTGLIKYFAEIELGNGFKRYESWLNALSLNGTNYSEIYKECVIPSPCWMIHRNDFEKVGAFIPEVYPEDYDLCFRMYKQQLKVVAVPEICHFWRDHGLRASRVDPKYADYNFLNLKISNFLDIDWSKEKSLVLWGAGKKGKWLANYLITQNIQFTWLCDNPKKIGKEIYGKFLLDSQLINLKDNSQFIVAVANDESKAQIQDDLLDAEAYFFA